MFSKLNTKFGKYTFENFYRKTSSVAVTGLHFECYQDMLLNFSKIKKLKSTV